jgi:hypothetical protein
MKHVNYKLIIDELSKGLYNKDELIQYGWMPVRNYLDEFRTIGFASARQTGKTSFLVSLVSEGKALIFTYDEYKSQFLDSANQHYVGEIYADRVLSYQKFKPSLLDKFKDKDIKYICLDESRHYSLFDNACEKILEVFGEEIIIIKV